jgi:hypothetical protein
MKPLSTSGHSPAHPCLPVAIGWSVVHGPRQKRGEGLGGGVGEAGGEGVGDEDGGDVAGGVVLEEKGLEAPDVLAEVDPEFVGGEAFLELGEGAGFDGGVDFEEGDGDAVFGPDDVDAAVGGFGGFGLVGVHEGGGGFGPAAEIELGGQRGDVKLEGVVEADAGEAGLDEVHADGFDVRSEVVDAGGGKECGGGRGHGSSVCAVGSGHGFPFFDEGEDELGDLVAGKPGFLSHGFQAAEGIMEMAAIHC